MERKAKELSDLCLVPACLLYPYQQTAKMDDPIKPGEHISHETGREAVDFIRRCHCSSRDPIIQFNNLAWASSHHLLSLSLHCQPNKYKTIDYCLCHTHVGEYVISTAIALATIHWQAQVDAMDAEFVPLSCRTLVFLEIRFMHVFIAFLGDQGPEFHSSIHSLKFGISEIESMISLCWFIECNSRSDLQYFSFPVQHVSMKVGLTSVCHLLLMKPLRSLRYFQVMSSSHILLRSF